MVGFSNTAAGDNYSLYTYSIGAGNTINNSQYFLFDHNNGMATSDYYFFFDKTGTNSAPDPTPTGNAGGGPAGCSCN